MRRFRRFTGVLSPSPSSSRCETRARLETLLGRHGSRDDPVPTSGIVAMHTLHKTAPHCTHRTELCGPHAMRQILCHDIQESQSQEAGQCLSDTLQVSVRGGHCLFRSIVLASSSSPLSRSTRRAAPGRRVAGRRTAPLAEWAFWVAPVAPARESNMAPYFDWSF